MSIDTLYSPAALRVSLAVFVVVLAAAIVTETPLDHPVAAGLVLLAVAATLIADARCQS